MKKIILEIAALASSAVKNISPIYIQELKDYDEDFYSVLLIDKKNNKWIARSPHNKESSMQLDSEYNALKIFTPSLRSTLPFKVPYIIGRINETKSKQASVYTFLSGKIVKISDINILVSEKYCLSLGKSIANIHNIDISVIEKANLPYYSAEDCRNRKVVELKQAISSGTIPESLVVRWKQYLEQDNLWNFRPKVIHGQLNEDNILINNNKVHAIQNWSNLHAGDPAEDLGWIIATNNKSICKNTFNAYIDKLNDHADKKLLIRAEMNAEFALVQWLLHGHTIRDKEIITDATNLLNDLSDHIKSFNIKKEEKFNIKKEEIDNSQLIKFKIKSKEVIKYKTIKLVINNLFTLLKSKYKKILDFYSYSKKSKYRNNSPEKISPAIEDMHDISSKKSNNSII